MDSPVLDDGGNLIGIIGISMDITARKEAEKALRETSLLIEKTFASLSDALFVVHRDTRTIRMCNAAAVSMFGYPAEELVGFSAGRLHQNDEAFAEFERMLQQTVDHGKPLQGEYRMRRRNGEVFPIEYVVAPLDRESGNVTDIVSVIRDITARKRAENQLRTSRQALRALARDLQSAREGERERVAREIHDELGQQLTAIRMDLDTLRSRLPAGNDRLRTMIDEMIAISDATVGTVRRIASELRPAILDDLGLPAAVEWLAEDFERRSGIECRVEVRSNSLPVDPDQAVVLFRIVQEALTNVARHSEASHAEVLLEITGDRAAAVVRDDGRGLSAEELSERRALGILGMRERALAVGGTFDVLGKSGCGTTVRVDIPRAEERSVHDSSHHRR
jgi:PAS domain S-box-containing protein